MRTRWLTPDLAICLFLVAVPWMLFDDVTRLWWLYDDAFLVRYAIQHHPADYLFRPETWQQIPNRLFTPLLVVSYDTDVTLFGLEASRWYHRHLVDLTLFTIGLYLVLRRWLARSASAAATLLMLLGAPFTAWAAQLMVRHYVESLIAAMAATLLFVRGVRRGDPRWSWLAGLAYFAAIAAKEISIPLPAVLLLLPDGDARRRVKHLVPMGLALALYVLWRRWMLGMFFGGYGWSTDAGTLLRELPRKLWLAFGADDATGIALTVILLALAAFLARRPRALALAIAGIVVAVLPIVPVSTQMEARYAVMPWLALVLAAIGGAAIVPRRAVAVIAILAAIALAAIEHASAWRNEMAMGMRMSAEGRAFLGMWRGDVLRLPAVPPAAMAEIRWLKEERMNGPRGAGWTYDDIWFCSNGAGRVFRFTGDAVRQDRPACPKSLEAPLRVNLAFRDGTLHWDLGPYTNGAWRFILGDGVQAFDLPRRGGFHLNGMPAISMRVRYQAPAGWVTYSPPIVMDFAKQKTLRWARP